MILALKTASSTTEAWLYSPDSPARPVASFSWESGRGLADGLLGRLVEFTHSRPANEQNLTGIIIFSGPGSFTSLRIGHTVANALADSLHIPVTGAVGEDWARVAIAALKTTPAGRPTLPLYGSEAHITRPRA